MKAPLESSAVLDRGGKPTVRELLSKLVFSPVDGTIRLNGDRLVMQRAAVGSELRRELVRLLGRDEARIFLIRLGYLSGQADARFVRQGWPGLNLGDAFTAGTRLHMFSGTVRVETVHNDFDFRKKRFSGEFLWHDSVEAAYAGAQPVRSTEPVCWTQIGYASGYASEFFDTLIVFKEVHCAAEGHKACRVIGKPADKWAAGDPEVEVFQDRIVPEGRGATPPMHRPVPTPTVGTRMSDLDRVLLAPVKARLERLARTSLPVLIAGKPGSGRWRAVQYLCQASGGAPNAVRIVHGSQVTVDVLAEVSAAAGRTRRKVTDDMLAIDDIASVPMPLQPRLAKAMSEGALARRRPLVAVMVGPATGNGISRDLWLTLSAASVTMPALADRLGDLPEIAQAMLPDLAEVTGAAPARLDPDAADTLGSVSWVGNLPELRAVLAAVLLNKSTAGPLTAAEIDTQIARLVHAADSGGREDGAAANSPHESILAGQLGSLEALEHQLYADAIARSEGNLSSAARSLGLTRAKLAYRLRKSQRAT